MGAREWALDQLATLGGTGTVMMGVLLVAGAAAAKGLFALHRYRSESRKEFLELWRQEAIHDDLWCEVAVRHLFGEYLPAALIRSLRTSPQAGRALLEISESWPLLEMNDETGSVTWRRTIYSTPRARTILRLAFAAGYVMSMSAALLSANALQHASLPLYYWVFPIFFAVVSVAALGAESQLGAAARSAPRWLGLP